MFFRVAMSESFRGARPDDVRERWPFRDFVHALLLIEMQEGAAREERERQKSSTGGRHG